MATASLSNHWIDPRILEDLAAEITIAHHPGIENRPKVFHAFTDATAVLIAPALENLVQAYRQACMGPCGGEAARRFLENMLSAED